MNRSEYKKLRLQGRNPEQVAINKHIENGNIVPIISNALRNNHIFDVDFNRDVGVAKHKTRVSDTATLNIDEELAEIWADVIDYPMPTRNRLAQIAQYNRIINRNDPQLANSEYLSFLKVYLLEIAEKDTHTSRGLIRELSSQVDRLSLTHIAHDLGYPKFDEHKDPIQMLAKLPLTTYLTTSYYDCLERVLQGEGKKPQTQICFWFGEPTNILAEHLPNPNLEPTIEAPLVYHLHGFERYPTTLVLSEDDYLDFLVKTTRDINTDKPIIPLYLREILSASCLLLLGYRLQDWDFRVLFRGLINDVPNPLRPLSVAIQLDPEEQENIRNEGDARAYLENYFGHSSFRVEWGKADVFVNNLWREWANWVKGHNYEAG